jgi:uncharacterized protein YjbI with pentapeptide repeats
VLAYLLVGLLPAYWGQIVEEWHNLVEIVAAVFSPVTDLLLRFWTWMAARTIEDWRNIVLILGVLIGFPLAIWRSVLLSKQTRLADAGQDFDRYQKGASMLGDDRLSVRQAGIAALEQLARRQPDHYLRIVLEVLCSFVRDRGMEQLGALKTKNTSYQLLEDGLFVSISADCQTALKAIAALNAAFGLQKQDLLDGTIDLAETNLIKADLVEFNLAKANLTRANLKWASVAGANLSEADMMLVCLKEANLWDVDLSEADLAEADLTGANLRKADLTETDLTQAQLANADLSEANLTGTDLTGTNLKGANLENACLSEADLEEADLTDANLFAADLSETNLENAIVTVAQLQTARNVDPKWIDYFAQREKSERAA